MCLCCLSLTEQIPAVPAGKTLKTQENWIKLKEKREREKKEEDREYIMTFPLRFSRTFPLMPARGEDNDKHDDDQEQEGGEDVAQRQQNLVSLVGQDDSDDFGRFSPGGVWVDERTQEQKQRGEP